MASNGGGSSSSGAVMLTSGASGRITALFSPRVLRSLWLLINAVVLMLLLPFRGRRRETAEEKCGKVVRVPAGMVSRKKIGGGVEREATVRRALAIKRVVEDDGENTVRDFEMFVTPRGDSLFTQSWTPVGKPIRGLVLILHGLNEHSSRYNDFAKRLNADGFKVYGMDWTGHGGSDGLHAYVHSLDYAVNDMKLFLNKILAENPPVPYFCFGHSTGGAIILKAVMDPKLQHRVSGIILTSPAIGVKPSHPIIAALGPVFSLMLPRFQFRAANKAGVVVSRDPDALVAKYSDPLVYTGSIRVRTGYEILQNATYLQDNINKVMVPFYVLHGTADAVTDPQASQKLHREAPSTDKTIRLCDGLLHDLLFEPEKEEITESIVSWLNNRC